MKRLWKIFLWSFTIIGFLTVLVLGGGIAAWISQEQDQALPDNIVLSLSLNNMLQEDQGPLASFLDHPPLSIATLAKALDQAARDSRVQGVQIKMGAQFHAFSQAQELRKMLTLFRKSGKQVLVYSDSFSDAAAGVPYYIATSADEIWMAPSGMLSVPGFSMETVFVKGLFDKYGITAEMAQRKGYKTAANMFLYDHLTDEHRKTLENLTDGLTSQLVSGIAASREQKLSVAYDLLAKGSLHSQQALDRQWIDQLAYPHDVKDFWEEKGTEFVSMAAYANERKPEAKVKAHLAYIVAQGVIHSGKSDVNPFLGDETIGADSFVASLTDLEEHLLAQSDEEFDGPEIEGLLIRINSPGGSYIASDQIYAKILDFKKKTNIPVIVSMGQVAASGGYFMAMAGDQIFALSGSLTGSIGVYGGKMHVQKLLQDQGITTAKISAGPYAGALSPLSGFTVAQRAQLEKEMDWIYADFVGKAAEQRDMSADEMEKYAQGQVWSGIEAAENQLIDKVGGLADSLAYFREILKLSDRTDLILVQQEQDVSPEDLIQNFFGGAQFASVFNYLPKQFLSLFFASEIQALSSANPGLSHYMTGSYAGQDNLTDLMRHQSLMLPLEYHQLF